MHDKYTPEILTQAKKAFETQGFIMLDSLFKVEDFDTLIQLTSQLSFEKETNALKFSKHTANITDEITSIIAKIQPLLDTFGITAHFTAQHTKWKDYSILSDEDVETGTHAYIELTTVPEDAGGMTYFLDEESDQFFVPMIANSITIVAAKGLRSFMKYSNHYSSKTSGRLFLVSK
jgi:hypothetical protein